MIDRTIEELEKISGRSGRGLFKITFRNSPGGTEETRETGYLVTRQSFSQM
jgi:hypothetical protein